MSEAEELKQARDLVTSAQIDKALPLLWKLYASKNLGIKLNAGLSLLVAMDRLTENKKLLNVTDELIKIVSTAGQKQMQAYLFVRKAEFLFADLSSLTYRQKNLNLAAGVFKWIDFSLEVDKTEYEDLAVRRGRLEQEISSLEVAALSAIESSEDHYARGHIFMSLGEIAFSRYLNDHFNLMLGGSLRSKIGNLYFMRRWNLYKVIGYNRQGRRTLSESWYKCIDYFKKAIAEFSTSNNESDLAHACYNFAVKFTLTYRFLKAKKYISIARQLAEKRNETLLLGQICQLEKQIKDKYRHPRDYVSESGLDLPRALQKRS